jgi:very-short-patch-repair endonuclease
MKTPHPWALPMQPVTRRLLAAAGVSDEMIHTALASGRLRRLRQGVFVASTAWPDDPADRHVMMGHAEQVTNPDAVLSHETAAVIWGLPSPSFHDWYEEPIAATYPVGGTYRSRGGTAVRHVRALPASDVVRDPDGYAVTTIARTATDLAAGLSLPEALVILDGAARMIVVSFLGAPRRRDFLNPKLVAASRDALATVGTAAAQRLAPVIALVEPARESATESLTAGHLHLAGLPQPLFQFPIETRLGILYPDFYWQAQRLIGECDGAAKGADPTAYVREKEREQVLRDDDYRFVRWLGKEILFTPAVVMARIERALAA